MRNWAGILPDMLCLICKHVNSLKDLSVFGGVCSTWRHVALEHNFGHPLNLPLPWLMLAENQHDDSRDFYSVTEGKIYSFNLPELKGKMCMETKGWIVTVSDEGDMTLVHPLTRVVFSLPHQSTSTMPKHYRTLPFSTNVYHVVISSPPDPKNPRDCVVAILHGSLGHIGFCRLGEKVWKVIDDTQGNRSIEYYRGKFYVATTHGEVWEYDLIKKSNDNDHVPSRKIEVDLQQQFLFKAPYLVESEGSLLVVIRYGIHINEYHETEFWVIKIDIEQEKYEEVMSLGRRAIFLGHSATMSIDTIQYPQIVSNSIYFTDDCIEVYFNQPEGGGKNMGVYTLKDKIIRPHYDGKSLSFLCPPVWTFLTTM